MRRCERCGADNPDSLKFCKDCGNRLGAPRVVEPTPPRGVPQVPSAIPPRWPSAAPDFGVPTAPAPPRPPGALPPLPAPPQASPFGARNTSENPARPRPAAPDFDFSPREAQPAVRCAQCGTENVGTAQFCAACGQNLRSMPPPALRGAPDAPVPAAPVLNVASGLAPAAARVVCPRCGGSCAADIAFCQFCGAQLNAAEGSGAPAAEPGGAVLGVEPARRPESEPPATRADTPGQLRASKPAADDAFAPAPAAALAELEPASPSVPSAALGEARLTVIAQDGTPGREYVLLGEQTDIGREEGAILLPNDPYVCPRHARLCRRDGRFTIRDLGSVNGVYVRLRRPEALQHGDLVLIGLEVLRFEVVTDAEKGLGPAVEHGTKVFGSPAAPRHARLSQRTVEGVTRDVFYVTRDEVIIGRESGDLVFTSDPFMSRRHAALTRRAADGSFALRDLGSSNGTYVAIRGECAIEPGDHVRIGQHLFRLDVDRKHT